MSATVKAPMWLFLLALTMSWVIITLAGFDGLYGQDSFHYLDCSRRILAAPLQALRPGSCYWPLGYPLLEAALIRLSGSAPLGAQLASTLTAAAIAPLVYWLALASAPAGGNRQARTGIGLAAGLIAALCGQRLLSSIVVMSDAPAAFWATLSACCLLRWARGAGQRYQVLWLIGCAGTLAIAAITRWIYAALLVPFGVFGIRSLCLTQGAPPGATAGVPLNPTRRIPANLMQSALLAAGTFCLIFLPQLHLSQQSASPALSHGWVVGWSPLNALRTAFDNPDGHFEYRFPPAVFYAAPFFHPFYLSTVLTPFVVLGAWRARHSAALFLLGGWILTVYLYLAGVPYENGRFALAFFPPVAVLAAIGLSELLTRHGLRVFWSVLLIALGVSIPFAYRGIAALVSAKSREVSAMRYLQEHVPADSLVVSFGLSATLKAYTHMEVIDLFGETPDTLQAVVCGARPVYVYVESGNIASQWHGKSPAVNLQWLQEAIGLQSGGAQDTWMLYRVRRCKP